MVGSLTLKMGKNEDEQISSFMNATLQGLSEDRAISIAVTLPQVPENVKITNKSDLTQWLNDLFAGAIEQGVQIECWTGDAR